MQVNFLCRFTSVWFHFQHWQKPTCKTTLRKRKQKNHKPKISIHFQNKNFKSLTTENYSLLGINRKGCVIFSKLVDISLGEILWMGMENQNLSSSRTNAYDLRPREVKITLKPKIWLAERRVCMLPFQKHRPVVLSTLTFSYACYVSEYFLFLNVHQAVESSWHSARIRALQYSWDENSMDSLEQRYFCTIKRNCLSLRYGGNREDILGHRPLWETSPHQCVPVKLQYSSSFVAASKKCRPGVLLSICYVSPWRLPRLAHLEMY